MEPYYKIRLVGMLKFKKVVFTLAQLVILELDRGRDAKADQRLDDGQGLQGPHGGFALKRM